MDINQINTLSIQVIEKRFKNYENFYKLLDDGNINDLGNSDKMDT